MIMDDIADQEYADHEYHSDGDDDDEDDDDDDDDDDRRHAEVGTSSWQVSQPLT